MTDHTPTTDDVRHEYSTSFRVEYRQEAYSEFDTWLSNHEEAIRAEEREKAAQIADDVAENPGSPFRSPNVLAQRTFAASQVAARIREQK